MWVDLLVPAVVSRPRSRILLGASKVMPAWVSCCWMVLVASWLDVIMADLEEILSRRAWVLDSRVLATLIVSLVMVWSCP